MDDKEISSCEDVHPAMPINQLVSTRQTCYASNLVNTNLEDTSMQSKQDIQDDDSSGAANDIMVHDSPPKMPVYDNRNNEHNFIANNIAAEVKRPVALRPSIDSMNRLHHLDAPNNSEIDILENLPTTAPIIRGNGPITNAPQLRIRPIHHVATSKREEKNMPSPLLRRGAAERAYLQGQLKAEALQRRKQEQHNEDRKMRGRTSISPIDIDGFKDKDIPVNDGGIQSMIEKFKFGLGPPQNDNNQNNSLLGFIPKRKNSRKDLRDFASSPPAILKKTFKRSVSAVLADSLGTSKQEEDGNLLYFPSGEQLQYEEQEDNTSAPLHDVQEDNSVEEDETRHEVSQPIGGDEGSVSVSETPAMQASPSSCSDDELSPSLVGADVIWQQGTFTVDLPGECTMPNLVSKKITLRPKMKEAPQDNNIASSSTHSSQEFKPIDDCNNSDCLAITTGDPQPKMDCTQAIVSNVPVRNIDTVLDEEDKIPLNYASPDKFDILASSESFQQLQFDNQVNRDRMGSEDRPDGVVHQDISSYIFSSPDAGFNHPTLKGRTSMMGNPQPLSEFNYKTPDNSENRRTRKSWEVMPKLPELGLPNMVIDVNKKQGLSEFNYRTPDNSENKRISKSREVMPKLLEVGTPDMMINATKEGEGALELELNNYRTPDHKKSAVYRKQIKDPMPKLPEMPKILAGNIDRRLQQGEASLALDTAAEEETDFSSEFVSGLLLKEPLSESNYRTPDHSLNSISRLQECERMPKLPELNSECKSTELLLALEPPLLGNAHPKNEEEVINAAVKTPC